MEPAERDRYLARIALEGIIANPNAYLKNCLRRVCLLLSPVPNYHAASPSVTAGFAISTIVFVYLPLILVGIALVTRQPFSASQVFLLVVIVLWYISHFLLNASVRNRLPSDTLIAALALSLWCRKGRAIEGDSHA